MYPLPEIWLVLSPTILTVTFNEQLPENLKHQPESQNSVLSVLLHTDTILWFSKLFPPPFLTHTHTHTDTYIDTHTGVGGGDYYSFKI